MLNGTRELKVLGEFKPFGLIAEGVYGNSSLSDTYDYFLFSSEKVQTKEVREESNVRTGSAGEGSDNELFVRGKTITWSVGARVLKRFTLRSHVVMACWCRFSCNSEALLCVLLLDSVTIYNVSGEVASIPLPRKITSIWSLPFGLLLQQDTEGTSSYQSSSPFYGPYRQTHCRKRESNIVPRLSSGSLVQKHVNSFEPSVLGSHLFLRDIFDEPELTYTEERGRLSIMKDFDEKTYWSSDQIPLMVSYNKEKSQHSLWISELVSGYGEVNSSASDPVPVSSGTRKVSFRRIWQGKISQAAASKVFLATDDDGTPVTCFLLGEQKKLLSVRLERLEINDEIVFDVKPDMSWTISAISAVPVSVTCQRVKDGLLPHTDIYVVTPEGGLYLYSGKQCLCKYLLPSWLVDKHILHKVDSFASTSRSAQVLQVIDAVQGRINIVLNGGKIFRCELQRRPSSPLVRDCITAMADGLSFQFYNHFLMLYWKGCDSEDSPMVDSAFSEWGAFSSILLNMCSNNVVISSTHATSVVGTSWQFLVNSRFHAHYNSRKLHIKLPSKNFCEMEAVENSDVKLECKNGSKETFIQALLLESLDSLHALYETLKLDNLRKKDLELLALLLCNIAVFLGEGGYVEFYIRDFPYIYKKIGTHQYFSFQRTPPSLLRWMENCLRNGYSSAYNHDIPSLVLKEGSLAVNWARMLVGFYSLLCGAKVLDQKLSSGVHCKVASGSHNNGEELTVLAMVGENFGLQQLDCLPSGVTLPLRHAIDKCRECPPTDWPAPAYILVGREDLAMSRMTHSHLFKEVESLCNAYLTSMSTPYMQHLHPVVIPTMVCESIGVESTRSDERDGTDEFLMDGMEHIFNTYTRMRYGRDLRLNEVRRLLCSSRPVAIQASLSAGGSDQDAQQDQLWQMAQRTTSLSLGRGAFTLATIHTLLTEVFAVPKLVLAGRLPAQQNATVNLDPSISSMQCLKIWPEFHNAVAAGLKLAPLQGKVTRTWIIYNKPQEPTPVHAGLLLALGLNGFLRVLAITDVYSYYTQEHESTSVGLMLGLAASYRGTMQPAISKSLYVHVTSRHSASYPELELPTLMQSAALVSVGLLYEGSVHPQTMQTLMNEFGRRSAGENFLEREGHVLAAGFAIGLVTLGRGVDAHGSTDNLVDQLLRYVGVREGHNKKHFSRSFVDEYDRGAAQMVDGAAINADVTSPGAIVALALMFLKTESEEIFSRLSIPQTHFDLLHVRPNLLMLRVIACSLIMWSRVCPTKDWVHSQIPEIVKNGLKDVGDIDSDIDTLNKETYVQAYVNIVTGACFSLGLKFAGTKDANVQELLHGYALYFLNEIKPISNVRSNDFLNGLACFIDRGTLENCLHLIVLSLTVVMAGSGHLKTFRLLRFLRGRNTADANYGIQTAVSMAIGFLFLGGGMRTFSTRSSSIAALFISLYPRLPIGPNDNACHLQAFRHLYVLASEARWIQTVDIDCGQAVYVPVEITVSETEHYSETKFYEVTPCILPERSILRTLRVCGPRYWPQVICVAPEDKDWWVYGDKINPFSSGVLFVKRKFGACSYIDDPIGCQLLLSRAMQKVTRINVGDEKISCMTVPEPVSIDNLVGTFTSDPSLVSFAQLCCKHSSNRTDTSFQEFCLQVLLECMSKDRPALIQVYLSLYTSIETMTHHLSNSATPFDPIAVSNLKVALAYNDAVVSGRLTNSRGAIVQSGFLGSLRKRLLELLSSSAVLNLDFRIYLKSSLWPKERDSVLLSWYLQWFSVPPPNVIKEAVAKLQSAIAVPLLRLLLPNTDLSAIREIDKVLSSEVPHG